MGCVEAFMDFLNFIIKTHPQYVLVTGGVILLLYVVIVVLRVCKELKETR